MWGISYAGGHVFPVAAMTRRRTLKRMIHQPTLMVTSGYDDITMTEFEVPAFHTIPSPRKKLVQVGEGASHMSLYDNPQHLRVVGEACADLAREYFCP